MNMKKYYASADEMYVTKGQRVWPREEAFNMMSKKDHDHCIKFCGNGDDLFWTKSSSNNGQWVYVNDKNIPTCVETEDKDAFREWLESMAKYRGNLALETSIGDIYNAYHIALAKYDELHAPKPAPQEPKPLFEVGEIVMDEEKEKCIIKSKCFGDGKWYYDVDYFGRIAICKFMNESFFHKLPKTKLVFSLEKWVEKRMKTDGAKYVVKYYDEIKPYDGKTKEEISRKDDLLKILTEPDLFVELEVK